MDIAEALDALERLAEFAYERGFHELGYDPVADVRAEIERLGKALSDAYVEAREHHIRICDIMSQALGVSGKHDESLREAAERIVAERDAAEARVAELEEERDARRDSLALVLMETLYARDHWVPRDWKGDKAADLITAVAKALDGLQASAETHKAQLERVDRLAEGAYIRDIEEGCGFVYLLDKDELDDILRKWRQLTNGDTEQAGLEKSEDTE